MVPLQICKLHIVIGTNTSTYHRRLFNFVPFGLDFHDFQELYEMWTHQTRAHLMLCFNLSQMTLGQQRTLECYRMLLMYGFLLCIVDIQVQFSSLPLTGKNIFRFSESLNDIMDYRLTEHLNILESCPFKLAPWNYIPNPKKTNARNLLQDISLVWWSLCQVRQSSIHKFLP